MTGTAALYGLAPVGLGGIKLSQHRSNVLHRVRVRCARTRCRIPESVQFAVPTVYPQMQDLVSNKD